MENKFFKKLFENLATKAIVAILGLIGTVITIFAFFQEKKTDLRYEVIANTNVLDFNADISKLDVIYDSTNLKQTNENLRIITLKVINAGNKDILKEFYDENDPYGIRIFPGKVIEQPEIIQTSSDYLKRNLNVIEYQKEKITFSQVILESKEFFIIKLLVLHPTGEIPNITSIGKIAGQKEILVVNSVDVVNDENFISTTYKGSIGVQSLRLISYFLVGVLIFALIIYVSDKIEVANINRKKKTLIKEFKGSKDYHYTRMDDAIFDRFSENGTRNFSSMLTLLEDESKLNNIYTTVSQGIKSKEFRRYRRLESSEFAHHYDKGDWRLINLMISDGMIMKDNDKLIINLAMKDTFERFISFLKQKKEFNKLKYHGVEMVPELKLEVHEN